MGGGSSYDGETRIDRGQKDDGTLRYDRYSNFDGEKHTHDWAKVDGKTGKYSEGSHGENAKSK